MDVEDLLDLAVAESFLRVVRCASMQLLAPQLQALARKDMEVLYTALRLVPVQDQKLLTVLREQSHLVLTVVAAPGSSVFASAKLCFPGCMLNTILGGTTLDDPFWSIWKEIQKSHMPSYLILISCFRRGKIRLLPMHY